MGLIKLQAGKELGRSFAGLYALNEGLFKLGFVDEETYLKYEDKYSSKLVAQQSEPLTLKSVADQAKLKDLEKQFSDVLKQGVNTLSEKSRKYWVSKAVEYQDKISNAKLILDLVNGEASE